MSHYEFLADEFRRPDTKLPRIFYWFAPRTTPSGDAPVEIRREWIDVRLPLRYELPLEAPSPHYVREIESGEPVHLDDGVAILYPDAVNALRIAGRQQAAVWWDQRRWSHSLVFRREEGQIVSDRRMRQLDAGQARFDTGRLPPGIS